MKTLKMMCGLPRSGKSTWIEQNRDNEFVLCADKLRYRVYGQRFWQDGEPLMWNVHSIMLDTALEQGIDIIIDETNVTPERRKPIIERAKKYGYKVICVRIPTTLQDCLRRAMELNDCVILPVIARMATNFIEPDLQEGFHEIWTESQPNYTK